MNPLSMLKKSRDAAGELVAWQMTQKVEAARRLVIYEQVTGFYAPWYLRLRVTEECARSKRYKRPLSLMVVEHPEEDSGVLKDFLANRLRSTDLVSRGPEDLYFVLLPETAGDGAREVAARLHDRAPAARVAVAEFAEDAAFKELLAVLDSAQLRAQAG